MAILLLESLHPEAEALLSAYDIVVHTPTPATVAPDTPADVQAILTRGRGRITDELLARFPGLRAVARAGVGLDNVDLAAAARRSVPVVFAPGANTATVAEHTLALMLALVRQVGAMAQAVAAGRWGDRDRYGGDELAGKTLGIVGYGAIGRRVAALGQAFGMEILVAARPGVDAPTLPLDELLARADVVSLHLPLTAETRSLIGARALETMKPGAYLVNTARGALVDQRALHAALESGRLAGFAADVLDAEPPAADDPLPRSPRALITPHVASLTARTYRQMCVRTARDVLAVLRGEPPSPGSIHGR